LQFVFNQKLQKRPIPIDDVQKKSVLVFEVPINGDFGSIHGMRQFFEGKIFKTQFVNEVYAFLYYFSACVAIFRIFQKYFLIQRKLYLKFYVKVFRNINIFPKEIAIFNLILISLLFVLITTLSFF